MYHNLCIFTWLAAAVLTVLFIPKTAYPADIKLAWDANNEPDIAGYRVFYRQSDEPYNYKKPVWEGPETTCRIEGLETGPMYCFVARAFDTSGIESADSNEVCHRLLDDTDGDGLPASNPDEFDTDGDGYPNATKVEYRTDPSGSDSTSMSTHTLLAGLNSYPSDGGWIQVFSMEYGGEIWLRLDWPEYNASNGEVRIATGDIDGDGKQEIVIGFGPVPGNPSIPGGFFQVLDDDYSPLAWGRVQNDAYNQANGETWPACGDLDGDGVDEIVIGMGRGGYGKIEIFDYGSAGPVHRMWTGVSWSAYNAGSGEARPACGDIDGDGRDEIIIGLAPIPSDPLRPNGFFVVLDHDGSHLAWGRIQNPEYNDANGESRPACADLDGDGMDEIVMGLGAGGDGYFEIFDYAAGQIVHRTSQQVILDDPEGRYDEIRPACGDLDGDGRDEILIGFGTGGGGRLQVFDDATAGYAHLTNLRIVGDDYNNADGGTWPAVK